MQPNTLRAIAILVSRVLALYCWVEALSGVSSLSVWLSTGNDSSSGSLLYLFVLQLLETLALIGVGFFLWRGSGRVAGWLLPASAPGDASVPGSDLNVRSLHAIAFSTLGLWIISAALPESVSFLGQLPLLGSMRYSGITSLFLFRGIGGLLRIALGVYLVFGGAGLAEVVRQSWSLARTWPQRNGAPQA